MGKYDYRIVSAQEKELERLRGLLKEHGISWAVLEIGHSSIVAHMTCEYWSVYKTPLGYRIRTTRHKPCVKIFSHNAYGWKLQQIIEVYKLLL